MCSTRSLRIWSLMYSTRAPYFTVCSHQELAKNRSLSFNGTVSWDFLLQVFSWITFPQAPDNNIRIISNFFENSRRYSQVKVHHRCQQHWWQILQPVPLVLLTPVANLSPVSTIPVANLSPVSTTQVANCHRYQRHRRQICHQCHWHRWQIIGTISGCRHLKVNFKAKIYIYVSSTTQRWPNKIIKFVWSKIFSICHRCRWHRWQTLSCEYLRWEETDSWKEPEAKNLVTLSL